MSSFLEKYSYTVEARSSLAEMMSAMVVRSIPRHVEELFGRFEDAAALPLPMKVIGSRRFGFLRGYHRGGLTPLFFVLTVRIRTGSTNYSTVTHWPLSPEIFSPGRLFQASL